MTASSAEGSVTVAIAGLGIEVFSRDAAFLGMIARQYAGFAAAPAPASIRLEVDLTTDAAADADEEVQVRAERGLWSLSRGDFQARYDPVQRRGTVRQSANRHSIDSVIRILHTLTLAGQCGFLLHAAGVIRNGNAFLFPGRSGAGKTTLAGCAPRDACLLSDEVSCVRRSGTAFLAWGTPFTGELATPGVNRSAPVKALCFLRQAAENRLVPVNEAEALRLLMLNVLFFANDPGLVRQVFETAGEFVAATKAFHLDFAPGPGAWELIQ